jgi:stage II sporulation protein M
MKKKKNFDLKKQYAESLEFIKESKKFIYLIIILFFIFSLIGFFVPTPEDLRIKIIDFIKDLIEKTEGMSSSELVKFIFLNNLQSSFFAMVFGVFLGIFPIFMIIVNGYVLGFVALISVETNGLLILWRILPHGIFELPAIFISAGLGLKLGTFIFQKKKIKSFNEFFLKSLKVFLLIVLPLLIIAAIIEGILISFF